jgi:hypothetical protein
MTDAIKAAEKDQSFKDGKSFGKPCFLKRDSYALTQLIVIFAPMHAEDLHITRGGTKEAFENFDGGRFACAVGSQESEAFTAANFEIKPVYGIDDPSASLIVLVQAATGNNRFC